MDPAAECPRMTNEAWAGGLREGKSERKTHSNTFNLQDLKSSFQRILFLCKIFSKQDDADQCGDEIRQWIGKEEIVQVDV